MITITRLPTPRPTRPPRVVWTERQQRFVDQLTERVQRSTGLSAREARRVLEAQLEGAIDGALEELAGKWGKV